MANDPCNMVDGFFYMDVNNIPICRYRKSTKGQLITGSSILSSSISTEES